jgi:hypothetical protein
MAKHVACVANYLLSKIVKTTVLPKVGLF